MTNRLGTHFKKHIHFYRRGLQYLTILVMILIPFFNLLGFHWISGTFYSMSFGKLEIADPSLVLQTLILPKNISLSFLIAGLIPLFMSFFLGKVFCSWICPFNLVSEWVENLRRKIKKVTSSKNANPKWKYKLIYFISLLITISFLEIPLFSLVSMPGLITAQFVDFAIFRVIGAEIGIVFFILILEFAIFPRFWCKSLCPAGLFMGVVKSKHSISVVCDSSKCGRCPNKKENPCNSACSLNLNPKEIGIYPYCNNCFECVRVCSENNNALRITFYQQTFE